MDSRIAPSIADALALVEKVTTALLTGRKVQYIGQPVKGCRSYGSQVWLWVLASPATLSWVPLTEGDKLEIRPYRIGE